MPGKKDEMTGWLEEGRKRVHKYYLTMYLNEAYALYLRSCDDEKCSFSSFLTINQKVFYSYMTLQNINTNENMKTFF